MTHRDNSAASAELGQMTITYGQETNTTPAVEYTFDTAANGSRLLAMTYPDGRVVHDVYNSGLDSNIGRLSATADDDGIGGTGTTLESYKYLGVDTVVERDHPEDNVNLTYIASGTLTGDGGDKYAGLDRFGRVVDQKWISGSTIVDEYQYAYDRDSNVTSKINVNATGNNETYTYNGLNELTSTDRADGTTDDQSWNLDALGNMTSVTTDGTATTQTHDSQNELTAMGSLTLSYDNNGNTTIDDQGHHLTYDAWNRLTGVYNDNGSGGTGTLIVAYAYDGTGRHIRETDATGSPIDLYYSANWQVLEERQGPRVTNQYVWSPVYTDALIERDSDADGVVTNGLEQRTYVTQDANYDVTSLIATDGTVEEHFTYNAYGKRTDLDGSWTPSSDGKNWLYSFQGLRYNAATGLLNARNRDMSISMMRWISQDPMGYVDGSSVYRMMGDNPINFVDPNGLDAFPNYFGVTAAQAEQAYADAMAKANEAALPKPEPEIFKTGCNKFSEFAEGSFYDIVGGGLSLEVYGEHGKFSNGATWVDVGVTFDVKVGLGVGGDVELGGMKLALQLKGPQLGKKLEGHYVSEPDGDGAYHLDSQSYLDLSGEGSIGEEFGASDKLGIVVSVEYGIEANKTGIDGYVSLGYKFTNEFRVNLVAFAYTKPVYFAEDGKTFKTPRLTW